jgi:hypothetical protein
MRQRTEAANAAMLVLLIVLAALLSLKFFRRQDQKWYQARALAESVKTLSWRFAMKAHPFASQDLHAAESELLKNFSALLAANDVIATGLAEQGNAEKQLTDWMVSCRSLSLKGRAEIYLRERIQNQRRWYAAKARANSIARARWVAAAFVIYLFCALTLFGDELGMPKISILLDPMIVMVTGIVGWLQVKRHSELSASYGLTAHEIGFLESRIPRLDTEERFSEFVNEAELAFSREHTQWLARQDTI